MGTWRQPEIPWYETRIVNCSLCGKMIPRRAWVGRPDGVERVFCSPACELLFTSYWLPRYGSATNAGATVGPPG